MSKLAYALLGAGTLAAVASLGSRVIEAGTLLSSNGSGTSSSSNSSSSNSSSSTSSSSGGPICGGAAASVRVIWPPDHKMVKETILGVMDPSHLPTTITIMGIQQDEPVEALGSGNTEPDGFGVGTPTAYVRAERSGPGTGRIYFISFMATDAQGACMAAVSVWVPHDQGQGFNVVDTGKRYDSTALVD
jgi:hypothetical protein